jgi:hypothetical protein
MKHIHHQLSQNLRWVTEVYGIRGDREEGCHPRPSSMLTFRNLTTYWRNIWSLPMHGRGYPRMVLA